MLPVFRPGQAVIAAPAAPRPGDCAVYSYKGRALLHRVLRRAEGGLVLADDAGRLEPHFVPWSNIRGRAEGGLLAGGLAGLAYCRLRRLLFSLLRG